MQEIHGVAHPLAAAALRSGLADALVLPSCFDDATALADIVAYGFFHIDVFARLYRPDGRQGMPVVGRGNGHQIDGFVFQDPAKVLFILGGLALDLFDVPHGVADNGLVDIADGGNNTIIFAGKASDMAHALAADANNRHMQPIVRGGLFGLLGLLGRRQRAADQPGPGHRRG